MDANELQEILNKHVKWTDNEEGGERANLSKADLSKADLRGAQNIWRFGPLGSRGGETYAVMHADGLRVKCGCFWGTLTEFAARVDKTYPPEGGSVYGDDYRALVGMLRVIERTHKVETEEANDE